MLSNSQTDENELLEITQKGIGRIDNMVRKILARLGGLKITARDPFETSFPMGMPVFTRSVSWLVESTLVQNIMKYQEIFNISEIGLPESVYDQYDCVIEFSDIQMRFYLNVKASDINARNRYDDISKAKRIIEFLADNDPLIVATVKIEFYENYVVFHPEKTIIFNVGWINDIKYNPHNRNLQTHTLSTANNITKRTNAEFIELLRKEMER